MELKIDKSNWVTTRLGDVCTWYQRDIPNEVQEECGIEFYVTANHIDGGEVRFNRYDSLSDGQKGPTITKHFEEGDLLLSTRSVALRKAAIAPVSGVTGEKLLVLRTSIDSDMIPDLMPFVFQSDDFWNYAQNSASGSVNKFTSWTKIREYEFLLPPKDQQAEIAELLWALDEVRELRLSLGSSIKVMMDVEFAEFTSRGEGEIVEFSSLFELTKEKSKSPHSLDRYVGLEHIEPGAFSISSWGNSSSVKGDATILLAGDVGYSKLRPYLDKAFIADFDCVASTEVLNLRPIGVAPRTLLQILHSAQFLKFISDKGYGTKMPRVNEKIIGSYRLRLPADEDALLVRVDSYQNLLSEISMSLRSSHDLSLGLINKVFNHV